MNVVISSNGTGAGTKVTTPDGQPIRGLTAVTWRMAIDEISRADLELSFVEVERVDAVASVYVGGKEVRRIEYADGTFDEYPED